MDGNNDDQKSQIAGQPNQGIPTPRPNLKIKIGDDMDESKSKVDMVSACDQSIHEINDVASKYSAYMKDKQNKQKSRAGERVERWKKMRKDNELRRSQLNVLKPQEVS